jgi:hypothetical protein
MKSSSNFSMFILILSTTIYVLLPVMKQCSMLFSICLFVFHRCLSIIEQTIYVVDRATSFRLQTTNTSTVILRTQHTKHDDYYRGFNLTYRTRISTMINTSLTHQTEQPCGRTYSSSNGTIAVHIDAITRLICSIMIEVDDGQNIYLRFDVANWNQHDNSLELNPNRSSLFRLRGQLTRTNNMFTSHKYRTYAQF